MTSELKARLTLLSLEEPSSRYSVFRIWEGGRVLVGLEWHARRVGLADEERDRLRNMFAMESNGRGACHVAVVKTNLNNHVECLVEKRSQRLPFGVVAEGIVVDVVVGGRADPEVKRVGWIQSRKEWEESRGSGVCETIMTSPEGEILEGLTSNVFVVVNGALMTAPARVLPGHIRGLILQLCERNDIPYQLHYPSMRDIGSWEEVFLTSGLKILQPVDAVRIRGQEIRVEFPGSKGRFVQRLGEAISNFLDSDDAETI